MDSQTVVFYPDKEKLSKLDLSKKEKVNILTSILLSTLMGDDTRLVKQFNDQRIDHGLSFLSYNHENEGSVSFSTLITDKKYFKDVLSLAKKEFAKIAKEGLDFDELKTIRTLMENDVESSKEHPSYSATAGISTAEALEDKNWLDYTEAAQLKNIQEITKDEKSFAAFNEKVKAFADTYLVSAKQKIVEKHFEEKGNVRISLLKQWEIKRRKIKSENHYKRPVLNFTGKHKLARMPWDKVSFTKQGDNTFVVNDKESNLVRVSVVNPHGFNNLIDPKILNSGDDSLIRKESYRLGLLKRQALALLSQTQELKRNLLQRN